MGKEIIHSQQISLCKIYEFIVKQNQLLIRVNRQSERMLCKSVFFLSECCYISLPLINFLL